MSTLAAVWKYYAAIIRAVRKRFGRFAHRPDAWPVRRRVPRRSPASLPARSGAVQSDLPIPGLPLCEPWPRVADSAALVREGIQVSQPFFAPPVQRDKVRSKGEAPLFASLAAQPFDGISTATMAAGAAGKGMPVSAGPHECEGGSSEASADLHPKRDRRPVSSCAMRVIGHATRHRRRPDPSYAARGRAPVGPTLQM